jgi:type II secretory pathway pseudopilin PulG
VLRREVLVKGLLSTVTLGMFELVDCLWPLGDATNRALHDKIVGTHVYIDPARDRRHRVIFAIVGIGLLVFFLMGVVLAIAIPTFLNQRQVNAQQNAVQVQALERDMGTAFAVEREAGLRNQPPALDTGTQLVGDIATAEPGLQTVLSSDTDPGQSDARAGLIYLGATTPTAFEGGCRKNARGCWRRTTSQSASNGRWRSTWPMRTQIAIGRPSRPSSRAAFVT